ncbi:RNA methyltransferase [Ligilactobacillus sp. WILCCON 0076]|uniref:RNA methyltransferase n=2 Tax=Ligilactobacillus ubinensis TaxID=2876789 RepID=A0A9X2FLA2_9LACO|nr:RNA methyltransferase [Ligilactobacillus ubinensis]MCP0887797.1 RNA methyltransferase [Ligilactobacillus ubinensis]
MVMEINKVIKSTSNQQVKEWKKLKAKKERVKQNKYVLEGWHLVKEAMQANEIIETLLITPEFKYIDEIELTDEEIEVIEIYPEIAKQLSDTPSPQGIFAIVLIQKELEVNPALVDGAWLLLDRVQDPGNIGTMVRTADAAGFAGVIFGDGSADIYQPKVVRAMQGSQFHIKLISGDLIPWIEAFKEKSYPIFGSELNEKARPYDQVGRHQNFALIMGNEGNGMAKQHLEQTSLNLYIPIKGRAESLNVAVAAGILMFQLHE